MIPATGLRHGANHLRRACSRLGRGIGRCDWYPGISYYGQEDGNALAKWQVRWFLSVLVLIIAN